MQEEQHTVRDFEVDLVDFVVDWLGRNRKRSVKKEKKMDGNGSKKEWKGQRHSDAAELISYFISNVEAEEREE
ncbi:unnamed protein product [Sphenostylis stenocarpa]|uniref:Uncharacterized protein n=1 Tax=Sphenostylis stenocarpa TaxID=92480 RepID=A0AA86VPH9_9FABA|nr:unnamed protein product [Sphenostylis stenocarpa]